MNSTHTTYSVRLPTGRTLRKTLPYDLGPRVHAVIEHLCGTAYVVKQLCREVPRHVKTSQTLQAVPAVRVTQRNA